MENLEKKVVIRQDWEESEAGWGVRPDGCSLHLSLEDCQEYIERYWARMPKRVPAEYERPCEKPYEVEVTVQLYERIQKTEQGLRLWHSEIGELEDKGDIKDVDNPKKAWTCISKHVYGGHI